MPPKITEIKGDKLHFYHKNLYDPGKNPRQVLAHRAPERYILYGGAWGGGKTAWLVNEAIKQSLGYPNNRGFIGCKYGTDFKANAYLQLLKFLPPELYDPKQGGGHHKSDQFFKLLNGSTIMYGGLGNDEEAQQNINNMPELGWFAIDQAEQLTESQFLLLNSRLRLNLPDIHYKALLTANPDPGWLRDRFIENTKFDHTFIAALPKDNPFLPENYEKDLIELYGNRPEFIKRLLEGDWDIDMEANHLIPYMNIRKAVEAKLDTSGDKVAGVDVSRYGDDETVFLLRQGDKVLHIEAWSHEDTQYSAGKVARLIREHKPVMTHIDIVGMGAGVFDPLNNEGYAVRAINVGEAALEKDLYANKRAELYNHLAKRFEDGRISIPDHQKLTSQLASLKYAYHNTKMQIESKEVMRKRGLKSPDYADAIMLAFIPIPTEGAFSKIPVTYW